MTYPDEPSAQRTAEPTGGVLEMPKRVFSRLRGEADLLVVGFTFVGYAGRFLSNIALSHLLFPQAFGQTAIIFTILAGLSMLLDVGMFYSVVSHEGEFTREDRNRFWTLQVLRGAGISVLAALAAPLVALGYGDPALLPLMLGAALCPIIGATASVGPMIAMREGRPALNMTAGLVGQVGGALSSILFAVLLESAWALILGTIAGNLSVVAFTFWKEKRLPRLYFDGAFLMRQLKFMRWFQVTSTMTFVGGQIDKLVFPLFFGTAVFGVYSIAQALAFIPTQIGHRWIIELLMPGVKGIMNDGDPVDHPDATRPRVTGMLYLGLMCAGIVGVSGPFFTWVYPDDFAAAAIFCPLLAMAVFVQMAELALRQSCFLVTGRQKFEAIGEIVRTLLFLALVFAIVTPDSDPVTYILIYLAAQMTTWIGFIVIARGLRLTRLRTEVPPAAAFAGMAAGFFMLGKVADDMAGPFVAMALLGVTGLAIGVLLFRRRGLPRAYRRNAGAA